MFSKYIKNTESKNFTRGPHPAHEGGGAPYPPGRAPYLVGPLVALRWHSSAICPLSMGKNHKPSSRMKLRRHEAEPWRNQSRALAELFCRGNFPPGGGNHRHRHPNAPLIGRGQSPSAPSHLKTLVHLLYPILVSKSGIGASRLLVVLITPCS